MYGNVPPAAVTVAVPLLSVHCEGVFITLAVSALAGCDTVVDAFAVQECASVMVTE